ncbi:phage shock protein operon transcriptional activator [Ferrimonas sediminicola]|uniref:Phage shock protein operon transcriptional activator n=1 Tax=Ferrimonas sediminicola TaxID=2569538 RepID=A0A4U1B8L4_9GAMM|nr:phage shock protein operon transcriptional activator [Ferrimonas sediminicola]TKB46854.1 phage shock protein operon transcriptional activator [Ferrimonas sediminicola]
MANSPKQDNLIGESNAFLSILDHVSQVAPLDKPVLIIGERGTGKELIAKRLHFLSSRWEQPYITLNCAALNENLLESELFGHESGAFTGAAKRHEGRFERAHKGSLFLDELANTSGLIQEKLLRVIEYGEFERVGGSRSVRTDVRLICATNEDLPALAERGEFRADLLDRLAFDVITLPPLRERVEDILLLAEHFAINMARQLHMSMFPGFTSKAQQTLLSYPWPGNVRELKNVVERSVYRHNNDALPVHQIILDPFDSPWRPEQRVKTQDRVSPTSPLSVPVAAPESPEVPATNGKTALPLDFKETVQGFEVDLLKQALEESQFNQKRTAEMLGLSYHQLRGILKKYDLL